MKKYVCLFLALLLCLPMLSFSTSALQTVYLDGVQIRTEGKQGLRFIATVAGKPADYDEVGFVILPTSRLTSSLTKDTTDAGIVSSVNEGFKYYAINDDSFSYTICLTDVDVEHYGDRITARAFVKKKGSDSYIYTAEDHAYDLSVYEVAEGLIADYIDEYTSDNTELLAKLAEMEAISDDYATYLEEKYALEEAEKEENLPEPITTSMLTVDDAYWTLGTLAGATGVENTTNNTRIYTPGYFPAEGIEISFDGASGVQYGVLVYDKDFKYIGHNNVAPGANPSWITSGSYVDTDSYAGGKAAYFRFVMNDNGKSLTLGGIAAVASHLTIRVPAIMDGDDAYPKTIFVPGTVDVKGNAGSSSTMMTPAYLPVDISYALDSSASGTVTPYWYDASYNAVGSKDSAAYYRLSYAPGTTVTNTNVDVLAGAISFALDNTIKPSEWALGTIAGATGVASPNGGSAGPRIYTPNYYPVDGLELAFNSSLRRTSSDVYIVIAYDKDKNNLGTSGDLKTATYNLKTKTGTAYVRFVMKCSSDTSVALIPDTVKCLTIGQKTEKFALKTETFTPPAPVEMIPESDYVMNFTYSGINAGNYLSDLTYVEDELWLVSTGDKASDSSNTGRILRYTLDMEKGTATQLPSVIHSFGHSNTVDYNPNNHCLTFGNGSGSFYDKGNWFYVYQNPYEAVHGGADTLTVNDDACITYCFDDAGIPKMTKINAVWYGDKSLLINANNNGYVYKIALGTGTRELALGTMKAVEGDEFNGTWEIVRTYTQKDIHAIDQAPSYIGEDYEQCNQGTDYADGFTYLTMGHSNNAYYWICALRNSDGKVIRKEIHKALEIGGKPLASGLASFDVYDRDYQIFGYASGVYVYKLQK